ncbi:Succinate-semialdehyde dehydrogenase [NADP(+)] [Yarrowia sp. C11]|nr:Succinate-semialdehyde dehydrogenase [NADP(+)] [Yarrowia sp. E02]KAG5371497.1 Succinate-semialdehyde dehydrogenase [NADP(+)] [Yarrowia sp. C11]
MLRALNTVQRLSSTRAMSTSAISSLLKNPNLLRNQGYINGQWVSSKTGDTFSVENPATGEVLGQVPEFSVAEADEAVQHAHTAFKTFKHTTGRERSKMLRKWYDLMQENSADLATLVTLENGKSLTDAKGEIGYGASFFEWFSEEAPRIYGDIIPSANPANRIYTIKQPIGVCGIITPWNFPSAMITRKAAAAVAAGCTMVIKPGSETPYSALALAYLAEQAGIPKGVVNVVTTKKNTRAFGNALCENPTVKKVSFTGSTGVGKTLMGASASTLKKLSFELGGNAPFIVFEDADIDRAVDGAIASKFRGTGQTCVCANRIYVHESIADKFAERMAAVVKTFKVGNGMDPNTTHGPLIHEGAKGKIQEQVDDAVKKGGKVLIGGSDAPEIGKAFFQPTVIAGAKSDMLIASEETFGPIAAIFPFKTDAEVIEMANKAEVGLAGYFYSKDVYRIQQVAEALEVGMVGVNTGLMTECALPFGGIKESGFGREGSKYGLDDYMVLKTIVVSGVEPHIQP